MQRLAQLALGGDRSRRRGSRRRRSPRSAARRPCRAASAGRVPRHGGSCRAGWTSRSRRPEVSSWLDQLTGGASPFDAEARRVCTHPAGGDKRLWRTRNACRGRGFRQRASSTRGRHRTRLVAPVAASALVARALLALALPARGSRGAGARTVRHQRRRRLSQRAALRRERPRQRRCSSPNSSSTGRRRRTTPTSCRCTRTCSTARPTLTHEQIGDYFKDATFGVQEGDVESTESPRSDVTIERDKGFGVPAHLRHHPRRRDVRRRLRGRRRTACS